MKSQDAAKKADCISFLIALALKSFLEFGFKVALMCKNTVI